MVGLQNCTHALLRSSQRPAHPHVLTCASINTNIIIQVHLTRLVSAVVNTLPAAKVDDFLASLLDHFVKQLGESGDATSRVFDPSTAVSLVALGAVAVQRKVMCDKVLDAIVAHEYARGRMQRVVSAVVRKLALSVRFQTGPELAQSFLPILLPRWLRHKAHSLDSRASVDAGQLLRAFPWFLFNDGGGDDDFLSQHFKV